MPHAAFLWTTLCKTCWYTVDKLLTSLDGSQIVHNRGFVHTEFTAHAQATHSVT